MERKSKLLSLTLAIIAVMILGLTSVVFAPPLNIGDPGYTQAESFDSNPKAGSFLDVGGVSGVIGNAFDGDLGTNINFIYGAAAAAGYVEVTSFKMPNENGLTDFPIAFLDIKVSYRATALATTLDRFRIVAIVGANTLVLQDYVWGTDPLNHPATYPPGINANPAVRTFSNVQEPTDGVWSWGDVAALRVRIETLQSGTLHTSRVYLYEVFATAYASAYPPALQMTVMPPTVMETAGGIVYYDIYITGVTNLWGFQFVLQFDPTVLTALEYMSYSPFISALPSEIGTDYVAAAYKTYDGDPVGFTGSTPLARIYFAQTGAPGSSCDLPFSATSVPTLANIFGAQITITWQGGAYNQPIEVPEFPPIVSFTESVDTAFVGMPISFDPSSSYDPDGTIVLYDWDFDGDGNIDYSSATPEVVSHTYTSLGTYLVTLTATDNDGLTGTDTDTIFIIPEIPSMWSSDDAGNPKDSFLLSETVYVTVPSTGRQVTLYVVADKTLWNDGDLLVDVSDGAEMVLLDASPGTQTIRIWTPPLVPGKYDIIMDVNNNGVFDGGVDDVDSASVRGIFVVPEMPFGAAMALAGMLVALAVFTRKKRFK